MTVGMSFRVLVALDAGQHLASIHFGQVQIQQDQVWARRIFVNALAMKEGHSLHAIADHIQMDGRVGIAEDFASQADVTRTIFNQKDFFASTHEVPPVFA